MLLAVGDVLANAHRYGGGVRSLRAGRRGRSLRLRDLGPRLGLEDPLAGHLPAHPAHAGGAGLWVARQMTRRLELLSSSHGLSVQLWI
jgi:hypothetical protein